MIKAKDKNGRELEFSVYGSHDDLQIDEIYYLDSEEEVPESVIDYLITTQQDVMYEYWIDREIGRAEAWAEMDR